MANDLATQESMLQLAQSVLIPLLTETTEKRAIFLLPGEQRVRTSRKASSRLRRSRTVPITSSRPHSFSRREASPRKRARRLSTPSALLLVPRRPRHRGMEPEIEPDGVALNAVHMLSGNTEERDPAETAAVFLSHVSTRITGTTNASHVS